MSAMKLNRQLIVFLVVVLCSNNSLAQVSCASPSKNLGYAPLSGIAGRFSRATVAAGTAVDLCVSMPKDAVLKNIHCNSAVGPITWERDTWQCASEACNGGYFSAAVVSLDPADDSRKRVCVHFQNNLPDIIRTIINLDY